MKKTVFMDIDGTLYSSKINAVPDSAFRAIVDARMNGHKIFLCTGRGLGECQQYLTYPVDGFIFGAGAMVYAEHKQIYLQPIPQEDVERITNALTQKNLGYSMECVAGAYSNEIGYEEVLQYFSAGETDRSILIKRAAANGFHTMAYHDAKDPVMKITFYFRDSKTMEQVIEVLPSGYSVTLAHKGLSQEDASICEITTSNIDKSTGIQQVLTHCHIDRADTIAIGDSMNDLSMIRFCEIGIAVGNAFAELKQEADYVTDDILKDGIEKAFIHFGLIERLSIIEEEI